MPEAKNRVLESETGERIYIRQIQVQPGFSGKIQYLGAVSLSLSGSFGDRDTPLLAWKRSIPVEKGEKKALFLEYTREGSISLFLTIRLCRAGTGDAFAAEWHVPLSGTDPILVTAPESGTLCCNLSARGNGMLRIGTFHARRCLPEGAPGTFVPGDIRSVTARREELFSLLLPGDLTPPLAVCFQDLSSAERFLLPPALRERNLPCLLLLDPRLESGAFFLGDPVYERLVEERIRAAKQALGFSDRDLLFCGETMGAFAALYYGARFAPGALLLETPILSLGTVAADERTSHPGKLETALDLLLSLTGGTGAEQAKELDARITGRIREAPWEDTAIAVARMQQDDCDPGAYDTLVGLLKDRGVLIYGKAFSGRPGSQKRDVETWLAMQLARILTEVFGR
ncbi:MAG: accessory Sec system protein Asp2 [Firmicutes bacterium]|nr:accessory Sec system protein Asp2 [Bacillota bacterium]